MVFKSLKFFSVAMFVLAATCMYAGETTVNSVHDFTLDGIDGKPYPLAQHKNKVMLIVNVASQCGYTSQYKGLQELHAKYADKGFTVIGVPANEFGAQEPGSNEDIKQFCTSKYNVTFPMLAKTVVKGEGICPLYAYLVKQGSEKPVSWNFNKFLVGKDGKVIAHFESNVTPDDPKLIAAMEKALAAK